MVAAMGIGWGVWQYYTDITPAGITDEGGIALENTMVAGSVTIESGEATADSMIVKAFFGNSTMAGEGEECTSVFAVLRRVPKSTAVARSALGELLKGVSAEEEAAGYLTSINYGVAIQDLTLENGVLRADFSAALDESVGGSCRVAAIRKQIEATAKQFPTVTDVVVSVDGRTEDILQP